MMDRGLVYSKTPAGEEATRQRTRVVQRNLRMVLLQVDGQLNVGGLIAKIGNEALVLGALRELEKGGYIALSAEAPSIWEQSKQKVKSIGAKATALRSEFSSFGHSEPEPLDDDLSGLSSVSQFSTEDEPKQSKKAKPAAPVDKPSAKPAVQPPAPAAAPHRPNPLALWKKRLEEVLTTWMARLNAGKASGELVPIRKKSLALRIVGGVAALLVALFLLLILYPYNSHRSDIESALGKMTGVPVKIGSVGVQVLPWPSLALSDVRVGEASEVRIGTVIVPQLLPLYGSGPKRIAEVEAHDVFLKADFLAALPRLLEGVRGSPGLQLERLHLKNAHLLAGDVGLSGMQGEISLKPGANQGEVFLATAERGLQLRLVPSAAGVEVSIQSQGWKPSETSTYAFSLIMAKGLLQPGKLILNETEFRMAEGIYTGMWLFGWEKGGMSMAAHGTIDHVDVRELMKVLSIPLQMSGRLSGSLRLNGAGPTWRTMWDATEATMMVRVERGVIDGVDLGEAARRGPGNPIRGGQTKFERLGCELAINAQEVVGKNLEVDSGLVRASGGFLAKRDKTVEASLQFRLQSSVVPLRSHLRVSGELPVLQTVVEK